MSRTFIRIFVGILFLSVITISSPAQTPGAAKQAEGVDIILLIDESGSMAGSGLHPGKNDPYNKRNNIIKIMLADLFHSSEKGYVYRISVIEFGSRYGSSDKWQAQVTLSCFKIPDMKSSETKRDYRKRVHAQLDFLNRERNRGESDHGEALRLALKEIQKMESNPLPVPLGHTGTDERLKVVFMITDGKPYVKNPAAGIFNTGKLQNEIKNIIAGFPKNRAILYVFGLNNSDDYWNAGGYGEFWEDTASTTADNKGRTGNARCIENHHKIIEQILPVLSWYTDMPPCRKVKILEGSKYDCPPYIKSLEFLVEFPRDYMSIDNSIIITQPNGSRLSADQFQVYKNHATIEIDHPIAGIWEIKRSPGIQAVYKEECETAEYLSPLSPIPLETSHKITFKARGSGPGSTLVPLDQYPIEGKIIIISPGNKKDGLNASPDANKPGIFTSDQAFKFDQKGIYEIQFSGEVTTGSGNKKTVLESLPKKIAAANTRPLSIRLETPDSLTSVLGSIDQAASLGFYTNGKNIPAADVLKTNAPIEMDVIISKAGNKTLVKKSVTLHQKQGKLKGNVKGKIGLKHLLSIIFGEVKAKLTLKIDNRFIKGDYFLEESKPDSPIPRFQLKVGERTWIYILLFIGVLVVIGMTGLIPYMLFSRNRCLGGNKAVPVLVYRHGLKVNPDKSIEKVVEVYKRKLTLQPGVMSFDIPGSDKIWTPRLTIVNHCVTTGVRVTVNYEVFGADSSDKDRFEEVVLETTDNYDTDKHDIKALENYHLIFELKIKEN
jgi:uncharacterized protein YegL